VQELPFDPNTFHPKGGLFFSLTRWMARLSRTWFDPMAVVRPWKGCPRPSEDTCLS
jgi:hypothetical protein